MSNLRPSSLSREAEERADHAAELDLAEAQVAEGVQFDVAELARILGHHRAQVVLADLLHQPFGQHGQP